MTNPLSLLEAQAKYGEIHNGVWGQEAKSCVLFKVVPSIGSAWINSLTKLPVEHIYCNRDFVIPLSKAFDNILEAKLVEELKTFDGCFEIRDVRAMPGTVSCHSYALAIDINAFENEMGHPTHFSPGFIRCFTKAGFIWGGNFKRCDPMHFSLGW